MKTKEEILYQAAPYPGTIAKIPAGTPVVPADNLPEPNQFWACSWAGMTDKERSWYCGYGFLLQLEEVEND